MSSQRVAQCPTFRLLGRANPENDVSRAPCPSPCSNYGSRITRGGLLGEARTRKGRRGSPKNRSICGGRPG